MFSEGFRISTRVPFNDLFPVYKTCFEDAPWYECWSRKDVLKEYKSYDKIFGFYHQDKCVSFLGIYEYDQASNKFPISLPAESKLLYFSDSATLLDYRKRGLSTALNLLAIAWAMDNDFDYAFARTNETGSLSINMLRSLGFKQIDAYQEITKPRINGRVETDSRIFLALDLHNNPRSK